ncbi:hypothetical protein [Niallia taxi]|uniref:Uncharacterized protein n=1 Tax=Niallia taxi TaxID=2499688 RepID=A0A3S2X6P4_9BACI|nr:hypothetical protein [Niallia taxi]RVT67646.1 hypothetical protein EM808_04000 [Niallia taxi]
MPREKRAKFIAAKVNINQNIFSDNKEELIKSIPDAIYINKELQKNTWTWKFTDVVTFSSDGYEFIYGRLTKSRYENVDVVDGDKIVNYKIPKPVANKARFLYQIKNEVLIFEEGEINRSEFIPVFQDLIYRNNIKIGEIIVNLIPMKNEILREIRSIDVLTKIEFDIIPPNMIEKKTFKGLTDIIKDENATRMKTTFENDKGLNKDGEFIEEGIEMVSNAYGEVKAYGHNFAPRSDKKKGNKKIRTRFYSQDSVHMRKLNTSEDKELIPKLKDFALEMIKQLL